ncbi:unnamed protein product, partial [Aphanomyces euteiches]
SIVDSARSCRPSVIRVGQCTSTSGKIAEWRAMDCLGSDDDSGRLHRMERKQYALAM